MTEFIAGRFRATCHVGPQNGEVTVIDELQHARSEKQFGRIVVRKEDLPDLLHVLTRAIKAQGE